MGKATAQPPRALPLRPRWQQEGPGRAAAPGSLPLRLRDGPDGRHLRVRQGPLPLPVQTPVAPPVLKGSAGQGAARRSLSGIPGKQAELGWESRQGDGGSRVHGLHLCRPQQPWSSQGGWAVPLRRAGGKPPTHVMVLLVPACPAGCTGLSETARVPDPHTQPGLGVREAGRPPSGLPGLSGEGPRWEG